VIVTKWATDICFLITSFTWLYIESTICHAELSDQCILGKFGTFKKAYNACLCSYSSIRQPPHRIRKIVYNCTIFFVRVIEVMLFTCWSTNTGCLATNNLRLTWCWFVLETYHLSFFISNTTFLLLSCLVSVSHLGPKIFGNLSKVEQTIYFTRWMQPLVPQIGSAQTNLVAHSFWNRLVAL